VQNLRRAEPGDAADLTRLRALMIAAMGGDPTVPGWVAACESAFARRLAEPDRFAAWLIEVDGRPVSSGVGSLEVPRVDLRATADGRPLYEAMGFRELGGATMAWTASPAAAPGLGFAGPR
jgi:hypothetical protein